MRIVSGLLTLFAAACALGWLCGVQNCDVGFLSAIAVALLLGDDDSGGPGRRP